MKFLAIFSIYIFGIVPVYSKVTALSYEQRLRKLSIHLRGFSPSVEEYDILTNIESESDFLRIWQGKIAEYQASPEYQGKMMDRLYDLFQLRKPSLLPEMLIHLENKTQKDSQDNEFWGQNYFVRNSLDYLFRSLTKKNLSWLKLLNETTYQIPLDGSPVGSIDSKLNDFMFFHRAKSCQLDPNTTQAYIDNLIKINTPSDETLTASYSQQTYFTNNSYFGVNGKVQCDSSDPLVGGAITTARFLSRYSRSADNKNFKRAAAIFRIFLCDDMKPSIDITTNQEEILRQNKRFAQLNPTELNDNDPNHLVHSHPKIESKRHGSENSCRSCHYKLDPLANVFSNISHHLPRKALPGKIVFTNQKQELISVDVDGVGDVGKKLASITDVKACQVKHFWNWFIGSDIHLTTERSDEILQVIEEAGFKTNDVVAAMVSLPEFYQDYRNEVVQNTYSQEAMKATYDKVKPHFQSCTTCHTAELVQFPNLQNIPFSQNSDQHLKHVKKIARVLDIEGEGVGATMPPAEYTGNDQVLIREDIRNWICVQAPDAGGQPTFSFKKWQPVFCGDQSK